jgi:hypothetical protein
MSESLIENIRASFAMILAALSFGGDITRSLQTARRYCRELREQYRTESQKIERFIIGSVYDALSYTPIAHFSNKNVRILDSIIGDFSEGRKDQAMLGSAMQRIVDSGLSIFPPVES